MLGCVYLILAALLGREITHNFCGTKNEKKESRPCGDFLQRHLEVVCCL